MAPPTNSTTMEILPIKQIETNRTVELIHQSSSARKLAYSPYSKFQVGAALLTNSGKIFTGCNVENVSFSLTSCAERTAIVKAVSEGCKEFDAIAISAVMEDKLTSPCGACRQVLAEFNPKIKIYLFNPSTDIVGVTSLEHLLPESFNPETAKICQSEN